MTAQTLIDSALRLVGVIGSGETPTTEERDDAFAALNHLLGTWSAQRLTVPGLTLDSVTMTGATSYALTPRALQVKSAVLSVAGVTVPFDVVSPEVWAARPNRSVFYDGLYATGTLYVNPAPSSGTLELQTLVAISSVASLATELDFPPGYERAIRYALAVDLAPEYGRPVPAEVAAVAGESFNAIANLNRIIFGENAPQPVAA